MSFWSTERNDCLIQSNPNPNPEKTVIWNQLNYNEPSNYNWVWRDADWASLTRRRNISAKQRSIKNLSVLFVDSDEGGEGTAHS